MPNDPYPKITRWEVGNGVVRATLDAVDPKCHPGVEAGVFWLGHRSAEARVTDVVVPIGLGVEQMPDRWRVGSTVFGRISTWATHNGRQLLAICHTHAGLGLPALSRRDRTHSVKAPNLLSIVVGRNGGDADPTRWGWYEFVDGDYTPIEAVHLLGRVALGTTNEPNVWNANARGVFKR